MSVKTFWHDNRAIEGLPIRLVIALVVGVASLAVMMNVITGLDTFGSEELSTQPEPEIIQEGQTDIDVQVTGPDGQPISNATVIAKSGTARLGSMSYAETDANGNVTLSVDPELRPNQQEGTIELDIRPPEGDYTDDQENTGILVIDP